MTSKNTFSNYIKITASEVEKQLKKLAKEWFKKTHNDFSEVPDVNKHFTDNWLGGKMLRGTLVKLGYDLTQSRPDSAIFKPAAAFEILHTALLIHDDIIDKSPTRRGKPAMHIHKNEHYGISQAICLGDIGISLAGKLIAESDFSSIRINCALNYFYAMVNRTIIGEMMDVASSQSAKRTEKHILKIYEMKTANYSVIGPLTLGAILGGATEDLLLKLKLFAGPLGIAYQLQDDILGIFGDEKTLGKSTTSDIAENKNTLLIAYALKHADKQQNKLLKTLYGKKGITKKEQETVKKMFIETGSLGYSQKKLALLAKKAEGFIAQLSNEQSMQLLLSDMTKFLLARAK